MTLARCKETLHAALGDDANRVISLAGKWGTGKSHLWRETQSAANDESVKAAVYASLFGVSSLADLKIKLLQQWLPKLDTDSAALATLQNGFSGLTKILKGFHPGFSALDELALIATPAMLKGRFIVLDDIERKHDKLSIDEILGFIDDAVHNLDCRVLLILNSDQLKDMSVWETFREKVIDYELQLETPPAEAFDIAACLTPTAFSAVLKPAVEVCRVSNIRIIHKIIRVVNRLLGNRSELPLEVLERVIPSTTLLSAIHYKGLDDGPDFDFVLGFDQYMVDRMVGDHVLVEATAPDNAQERWRLLLDELHILGVDEFETLVVGYLKSGLLDAVEIDKVIDRYIAEGRLLTTRSRAHEFMERCVWHPEITEAQLLEELRALLPDIGLVDMFDLTSLHYQATKLTGGEALADELLTCWINVFREKHAHEHEESIRPDYNYFNRSLHPDIVKEVQAVLERQQDKVSLLDVCRRVNEHKSWGPRENAFMRFITPEIYEAEIMAASGHDLKVILLHGVGAMKRHTL